MNYPEWIDAALSDELLNICARGESQNLEFMTKYPDSAHELGKENPEN